MLGETSPTGCPIPNLYRCQLLQRTNDHRSGMETLLRACGWTTTWPGLDDSEHGTQYMSAKYDVVSVHHQNKEGVGKSRGRRGWISRYLPSFGGVWTFSHHLHQYFYREWIIKSFRVGREGLPVLKSIFPCWWWENVKCSFNGNAWVSVLHRFYSCTAFGPIHIGALAWACLTFPHCAFSNVS